MKCKKFIYAHTFEDLVLPNDSNFELVEEELPALKDGEVLCEAQSFSVDPYMRIYAATLLKEGDTMVNFFVAGEVIESKNLAFPVGTVVSGPMGWTTHAVIPGSSLTKLDHLDGLPISTGLNAAGMPGITAYFGLFKICDPKEGETMYVNSAAGAVGSLVGQFAKMKGCRVVGSAGSDEKVAYCKSIGFDEVFNYKTVSSLESALKSACPKGIDCFFENVGGPGFATVLKQMNTYGRVAFCGSTSTYNKTTPAKWDDLSWPLVSKQIKIEGFLVVEQWQSEHAAAYKQIVQWIKEGKLMQKEHVTKGFENFPKALLELFTGGNFGKAIVNV